MNFDFNTEADFTTLATKPDTWNDGLRTFKIPVKQHVVKGENKYYLTLCPEKIIQYLSEFYKSVMQLYPEILTESAFKRIDLPLLEHHKIQMERLLAMLTHVHTVLNTTYRQKDESGVYRSTKEDYVNALAMLQPLAELYKSTRNELEKSVIKVIKQQYKPKESFTRKDLSRLLNYGKSHTNRIIKLLEERQLIVRSGGFKNRGFKFILS